MIDDTKKKAKVETIAETEQAPVNAPEIQDINLGFVEKKKFRIGGDYNRMLELNVSDMNIYARFKTAYPRLQELANEATEKVQAIDVEDEDALDKIADVLTDIDNRMRSLIDDIFDTNASEVCAPSGNMFDPVDGQFRFERIIEKLSQLYTTGFEDEVKKFKAKSEKHTSKYTKKYHK